MKTLHTIYTSFAKRLVMLFILLVAIGIGNGYAAQETLSGSFVSSNTTSGGFTASGGTAGKYYKLQTGYIISDNSYSVDATKSISISMKVGTFGNYSTNKQSVDFYAIDKNGNIISNKVTASFSKANSDGTTFSGTIKLNSGISGNEVRFKFASNSNATSSVCARFYNFTITYESAPTTFSVTYNANGAESGDVPTDNQKYTSGASVPVLGNTGNLVKTGYRFDGWQINKSGTVYNAGGTFNISENTTLYAKWTARTLTNYRTTCTEPCEQLGDATGLSVQTDYEEGGQTYVKFSWTPADNTKSHATKQVICIGKVGEEKKCTDLEGNQVWSGDLRSKLTPGEYEWSIQAIGDGETYCDGEVISGPNFTIEEPLTDNCRWVEIPIEDITPEDEIVVTMGDDKTVYALGTETIDPSPKSQAITITSGMIDINQDFDYSQYTWSISAVTGGYQLQPYGTTQYLYGVASYITISSNPTTFSIFTSPENGNKCFMYTIEYTPYYLGHGTDDGQTAWKRFPSSTNLLKSNTLKFYKKACLPANKFWIDYELANVTCTNTPPHSQIDQIGEDLLLDFSANDGYKLPETISVKMGETEIGNDENYCVWDKETGALLIAAEQITDNITITVEGCERLAAPENLLATNITSTSTVLSWDAVAKADEYIVFVTDGETNLEIPTTNCTITIEGLSKNTYYLWDVTATADNYCDSKKPSVLTNEFTTLDVYTVTFTTNGGTAVESQPVDHGSKATTPANPTKTGYTFAGWYTESTCTNLFDFNTVITKNTTLYAKWTEWSYTITYAKGSPADEITGEHAPGTKMYTSALTLAGESFSRPGYKQTGWSKTDGGQKDYNLLGTYGTNEDVTLYPYWTKVHTITWMADGSTHDEATYLDDETLALPESAPEACQGSEFVGWTAEKDYSHATDAPAYITAGSIVNADDTYYAVYAEETEGDEITLAIGAETDNTNGNATYAYAIEVEGFSLVANKGAGQTHPTFNDSYRDARIYAKGSITLTAPKNLTSIVFNLSTQGKKRLAPISASVGAIATQASGDAIVVWTGNASEVTFTVGEKANYGSDGSSNAGQLCFENIVVTSKSSYTNYSTSCIPTYHVNYELAGGENGCADEGVKVGNDYTICNDEPTRTGYTFQYWTDGTKTYEADATIENVQSNITLTAVWKADTYTITWMSNGEEYVTTTHTYDQPLHIADAPYNCYGAKTFMGWTETPSVNENGEDITYIEESTNPSENKTYYAVFADEVVGEPEEVEATLSFANKAQRTSFSSTQQVWEQNGITLTNTRGKADNDAPVADYVNPARFYANSSISIQAPGNIIEIVFACSADSYVTPTKNSVGNSATSDGNNVAVELNASSNTFDIAKVTAQIRLSSLTVTYQSTPETTYSKYTTTPSGCPEIEVAENAYVTSAKDQSVKVNVPVKANNFANDMTITAAVEDGNFSVANVSAVTDGACTVTLAYKPTASNTTESATVTLTAKADDNEVTSTTFTVNGRSLPETFAVVAKVGGVWYALPSQGLNSTTPPAAYPVEVDNIADPTAVTAVPANADWSLRQVYASSGSNDRFADNGEKLVFVNDANPQKALNAGSAENYLLTGAQYDGYHNTTTPGLYEWTPTTTDLKTYTLTNAQRTDRTLNVATNTVFGVHSDNKATTEVRFLPITGRYTPAALQVVEWKENSVVIMYNGDPAQTASVSVNGAAAQNTTLSAEQSQRDIAVYELAATGLADNPTQRLSITIGAEKTILSIPYIISGEKTDLALLPGSTVAARQEVAEVSDLVILNGATLTADGAGGNLYKFRNVTIYGGGSLIIPAGKGFGANSLTMRVGGVEDGEYVYTYPQLDLNGTINSGNINLDLMTTYDYYYPFSVPYEVTLTDIHYPIEIYGSNVKPDNKGSFLVSNYDGEARAQGNTGWKDVEEQGKTVLSPHVGYSIWGLPKKVSVNGATSVRQTYGIHRIPMKKAAGDVMDNETKDQNVSISAYNATRDNDKGWNFIGNPYLVQHGGLDGNDADVYMGLLVKEMKDGQWTGGWVFNGEQVRYVTQTNDCLNYTSTPVANATVPAFSAFFIQAKETGAIAFTSPNVAAAQSLTARRSDENKEITTGIILSGEKHSDRTGLLIADQFTEAYEFNADLSKFDNQDMNLYTISPNGKLAFMAINEELAKQTIPLGYSVSADGMYTIAFDEQRYNRNDIYALYLIDYDRNETTNLLHMDYDFYSDSGASAERFALQVAFAPSTTTDIEYTQVGDILVSREGNTLRLDNLPSDATVTVYDAVGHLIEQHTASQLLQLTLQKGYYLLHIGNNQNSVVIDTFIP